MYSFKPIKTCNSDTSLHAVITEKIERDSTSVFLELLDNGNELSLDLMLGSFRLSRDGYVGSDIAYAELENVCSI